MSLKLTRYFNTIREKLVARLDAIQGNTIDLETERVLRELEKAHPALKPRIEQYRNALRQPRLKDENVFDSHKFALQALYVQSCRCLGISYMCSDLR